MLTLAVDTTAEFGSIALVRGAELVSEVLLHAPDGFSGILFGELEALLTRSGFALRDVDLFAAASGPGSFTGVRVGLAAVKGLAEVMGRPVVAVSNLEALRHFGTAEPGATVIDARRGEVFAAVYGSRGPVIPEQVIGFPRFLELLDGLEFEWISADFAPFRTALMGSQFERMPVATAPRAIAAAIAQIAAARIAAGESGEPAVVEANYVRRSDAELLWREPTPR